MCNCIKNINNNLAKQNINTQIDVPILLTSEPYVERIQIVTRKRDLACREKPVMLLPAYCPFCGKSYDPIDGKIGGYIPRQTRKPHGKK